MPIIRSTISNFRFYVAMPGKPPGSCSNALLGVCTVRRLWPVWLILYVSLCQQCTFIKFGDKCFSFLSFLIPSYSGVKVSPPFPPYDIAHVSVCAVTTHVSACAVTTASLAAIFGPHFCSRFHTIFTTLARSH
jgi:hypothetical protein